jgi:hypothetical protein
MKTQIDSAEIEAQIRQAIEGYRAMPEDVQTLVFPERTMRREEVIEYLQGGLDRFEDVRRTRAAHEAAVETHRRLMPGLKRLHAQALDVAKLHFGSDPKRMETFGLRSTPRTRTQPLSRACQSEGGAPGGEEVVTMVVEEVTIVSEQASCERQAPNCDEPPPRELPCRAKKVPSRVKPPGEEQKACGSRASRARK